MDHAQVQGSPAAEPSLEPGETKAKGLYRFMASLIAGGLLGLGKIALVTLVGLVVNWGFLVLFFWTLHDHTGSESHTLALWVVGVILGLEIGRAHV